MAEITAVIDPTRGPSRTVTPHFSHGQPGCTLTILGAVGKDIPPPVLQRAVTIATAPPRARVGARCVPVVRPPPVGGASPGMSRGCRFFRNVAPFPFVPLPALELSRQGARPMASLLRCATARNRNGSDGMRKTTSSEQEDRNGLVETVGGGVDEAVHSLHHVIPEPARLHPSVPQRCIARFAPPGGVVLDPFCRFGSVPLAAVLAGRRAVAVDSDRLNLHVTRAHLIPTDFVEVALFVQSLNLKIPTVLEEYVERFSPFFHPETFRELVTLREALRGRGDRVARFVELLVLGTLHGRGNQFLSTQTIRGGFPSPEEQRRRNAARGAHPEYRAVIPRILRKAAVVLRDGPIRNLVADPIVEASDARSLPFLRSATVDLVVSRLPTPDEGGSAPPPTWGRTWFTGIAAGRREVPTRSTHWGGYMAEVCAELSRVVKRGGWAVLVLGRGGGSARYERWCRTVAALPRPGEWLTEALTPLPVRRQGVSLSFEQVLILRRK